MSVLCVLIVVIASPAPAVVTTAQAQTQPQAQSLGGGEIEAEVDAAASNLPGNGTFTDPYEISNASELQAMEDDLDANYEFVSDIDALNTSQLDDGAGLIQLVTSATRLSVRSMATTG